jgi:hypothetical protein
MQPQRRQSWEDILLVWGFVLSFAAMLVAGGFEAVKLVKLVPGAFESSPGALQNPMRASEDGYQMNGSGQRRMTAQERAKYEQWSERSERQ